MAETEDRYYDFIEKRLADYGIRDDQLVGKISGAVVDLHPAPSQTCSCGKPVVFVMHSREFDCTRCGKKWQLVMEVKPLS
ncbi:MAG: hypothetical protein Athens071412_576 [Parcubacteria group bacterium Athens0714_12]|nr:MAG: hypothetical protein Athens071412_576 [Parcubacteria group bacterium Athens0714_12]